MLIVRLVVEHPLNYTVDYRDRFGGSSVRPWITKRSIVDVVTTQSSSYLKHQRGALQRYRKEVCEGRANLPLCGKFTFQSDGISYAVDVKFAAIGMPYEHTDAIIVIYSGITEGHFGIGLFTATDKRMPTIGSCRRISPRQAIKMVAAGKRAGIKKDELYSSLRIDIMHDLLDEVFDSSVSTDTDDVPTMLAQGANTGQQ